MRKRTNEQISLGKILIQGIEIDLNSRDEVPKVLIGLQSIYSNGEAMEQIYEELKKIIPKDVSPDKGRPGMPLWNILVLGIVRLTCNCNYDKLREMANEHKTLRLMLGISLLDDEKYALQTLKDNISLFTPDILDKINQIVIKYQYKIFGKNKPTQVKGSCDSFPVKTNVHFPTDTNLLSDALRVIIMMIISLSGTIKLSGWRKAKDNIKKAKKLYRKISKLNKSKNESLKKDACKEYLKFANFIIDKACAVIDSIKDPSEFVSDKIDELRIYIMHAVRQIDQINRRIINDEKIPHGEKVFSIFEEHTEWIAKGKIGTPVELGLNVCVVKDQFGFILHHIVMQNQSDVDVAVPIIIEAKQRFENLDSCSFDKGFHSPSNQEQLANIIDNVVLPRKGKLSPINKKIENSPEFKQARRKHSAVESTINGLGHSGLDRCPDHGIDGFKRYVGLAVLARNIQIIGHAVQQQKYLAQKKRKLRLAA
ncbi:MAG: ISNCY family transposase [Desulfobacterales bacterium]|nr:ISNCY family transposase [Desulfobacterales bacterium]